MNPHAPRIRDAGDSALLIEWDEAIDPAINARAIATAAAIRGAGISGLRDVVSTYRSVAVFFDPLTVEPDTLRVPNRRDARREGRFATRRASREPTRS